MQRLVVFSTPESRCGFMEVRNHLDGVRYGHGASYQHMELERAAVLLLQTHHLSSLLVYSTN